MSMYLSFRYSLIKSDNIWVNFLIASTLKTGGLLSRTLCVLDGAHSSTNNFIHTMWITLLIIYFTIYKIHACLWITFYIEYTCNKFKVKKKVFYGLQ